MGDKTTLFTPAFNGSIRVESRPYRLTAEPGSMILREVVERLGTVDWLVDRLHDSRDLDLITHPLAELLNTFLLLLGQGWGDQDDADRLRDDPAMRLAVSTRRSITPLDSPTRVDGTPTTKNPPKPEGLASQPTLSRLVRNLSTQHNRSVLRQSLLETAARRIKTTRRGHRLRYVTVDIDSLPVEVHGHQPGSQYNGYYHARIYHPLVAGIAETGDLLDLRLRPGKVHTANGALGFILPLLDEVESKIAQVAAVRIDAGFPEEELLTALEDRRTPYLARIRNNKVLDRMAKPYLKRPGGRPPSEPRTWFHEMTYSAESWSRQRRVVLVVQEEPGELFLHHFWLLTNIDQGNLSSEQLLELYRDRGTFEGHLGELMSMFQPALSSSPRQKSHYRGKTPSQRIEPGDAFAQNEVILLLNALSYNISHVARCLLEQGIRKGLSLSSLRERVLRVSARVVLHAKRATLIIDDAVAPMWFALWSRLSRFRYVEA